MTDEEEFSVTEDDAGQHMVGSMRRHQGWCDGGCGYPRQCQCGGLIHAEFVDESYDSVKLAFKCDRCGSTNGC